MLVVGPGGDVEAGDGVARAGAHQHDVVQLGGVPVPRHRVLPHAAQVRLLQVKIFFKFCRYFCIRFSNIFFMSRYQILNHFLDPTGSLAFTLLVGGLVGHHIVKL